MPDQRAREQTNKKKKAVESVKGGLYSRTVNKNLTIADTPSLEQPTAVIVIIDQLSTERPLLLNRLPTALSRGELESMEDAAKLPASSW